MVEISSGAAAQAFAGVMVDSNQLRRTAHDCHHSRRHKVAGDGEKGDSPSSELQEGGTHATASEGGVRGNHRIGRDSAGDFTYSTEGGEEETYGGKEADSDKASSRSTEWFKEKLLQCIEKVVNLVALISECKGEGKSEGSSASQDKGSKGDKSRSHHSHHHSGSEKDTASGESSEMREGLEELLSELSKAAEGEDSGSSSGKSEKSSGHSGKADHAHKKHSKHSSEDTGQTGQTGQDTGQDTGQSGQTGEEGGRPEETEQDTGREVPVDTNGQGAWGDPHFELTGANGAAIKFDHKGVDGHQYSLFSGDNINITGTYEPYSNPVNPQIIGKASIDLGREQIEFFTGGKTLLNGLEIKNGVYNLKGSGVLEKIDNRLRITPKDGTGVVEIYSNWDGLRIDPSGSFSDLDGIIGKAIMLSRGLSAQECAEFDITDKK